MSCVRFRPLAMMALTGLLVAEEGGPQVRSGADAAADVSAQSVLVVIGRADEANYIPVSAVSATRTDGDPIRLPVSIGVVDSQVMTDQGARSVYEGIRNVSGVVQNRGIAFNSASDGAIIRGFRNTTMYFNGFLVEATGAFNPQTIERLEVLKGPAAMLYGMVEPGGLINVVSKQPSSQQSTTVEQSVGSFNRVVTNVDTTGPISSDGSSAYRLVGGGLSSDSFRDYVEEQRYWAAPSVAFRLGEKTQALTEALYSKQQKTLDEGVSFDRAGNAVAPISTFLGEPGLPGRTQTDLYASARIEHQVADDVKVRSGFLYHSWQVDMNGVRRSVTQATVAGTIATRLYDRSQFNDTSYQWTNDVVAKVHAGPTTHELLLGIDARWQKEVIDLTRGNLTTPPISITDPVYNLALPATPHTPNNDTHRKWVSGYIQDNASLLPDDSLRLLAGGRFDRVISDSVSQATGDVSGRDDNAWTGRAGLMWFPIHPIGIYANVATSFAPTNATSRTVGGELLDPERGIQYEAGLKMSALDKALEGTVAIYELTKENVAMADPSNPGFNINGGKQRSKGLELDLTANLPIGLSLIGNMAWIQSEILESDALPVGSSLENVPDRSGSIWGMYTIPQGALRDLSFGCGVFAESDKNGYNALTNTPNTFTLPGYARIDAAMAYKFKLAHGQLISARLNVLNVFDTTYYESSYASTRVFPGDPRTATLTLGATF